MIPFLITSLAGISTMIGSFLILKKKQSATILVTSLGFAAGVMITISVTDLIPTSLQLLSNTFYFIPAVLLCSVFFCVGILFSMLVDKYLPETQSSCSQHSKLYRVGIISCLAIILHNIPEGIITYITVSENISLGVSLAIAIALHNIPEGCSYYASHIN